MSHAAPWSRPLPAAAAARHAPSLTVLRIVLLVWLLLPPCVSVAAGDEARFTVAEVARVYWHWIAAFGAAVAALGLVCVRALRFNRGLRRSQEELLERARRLEQTNWCLAQLSTHDDLTGIANHRHFQEQLDREWRRARRSKRPLALFMVDIDYFKALNDARGHLAGDECLKRIAQALAQCVRRPGDLVARYGGEEFAAILPEVDASQAAALAERMRQTIEALAIPYHAAAGGSCVTVSIGIAGAVPGRYNSPQTVIAAADKALYEAKDGGRNRVCAYRPVRLIRSMELLNAEPDRLVAGDQASKRSERSAASRLLVKSPTEM